MAASSVSPEFSRLIIYLLGDFEPKNTREENLKRYIKLILSMARRFVRYGVEYEDLIMAGVVGLMEAEKYFDPERSNNFVSYAMMRILGQMYDYSISNSTLVYIPTHIGKARVHVNKMIRLLEHDYTLVRSRVSPLDVISSWEHPIEKDLLEKTTKDLRSIKDMVSNLAKHSKRTYEDLVELAILGNIAEASDEDLHIALYNVSAEDIERNVLAKEILDDLLRIMGEKKTSILMLHHQGYNNEDIADIMAEKRLTKRRISRQAIRGALMSAEEIAEHHVKRK